MYENRWTILGKKHTNFNATLESVFTANSITLQAYLSLQEITVLNKIKIQPKIAHFLKLAKVTRQIKV
jgi:hypothetical protein